MAFVVPPSSASEIKQRAGMAISSHPFMNLRYLSNNAVNSSLRWAGKAIFMDKTLLAKERSNIIDYPIAGKTDERLAKVISRWKRLRPAGGEIQ
jgi:hypothetical protein